MEDLSESLIVEPSVCVLAPKAPTLVLIPNDSTHDPLKDLAEPLKVEPSFFVLVVLAPKAPTPDPIEDPTEPLNVEPSVPLKVDAMVDLNGLVSTHGAWVIKGNDVDSTGVTVTVGTRRGVCGHSGDPTGAHRRKSGHVSVRVEESGDGKHGDGIHLHAKVLVSKVFRISLSLKSKLLQRQVYLILRLLVFLCIIM